MDLKSMTVDIKIAAQIEEQIIVTRDLYACFLMNVELIFMFFFRKPRVLLDSLHMYVVYVHISF